MDADFYIPADDRHIAREKNKAKELRRSQWWKRKRSSGRCHYCRGSFQSADLTMDHVVPLSRGGLTVKSNVVPSCKDCNSRKQSLLPIEWGDYLESLQPDSDA